MSHKANIKTEFKDQAVLLKVLTGLGMKPVQNVTLELFEGNEKVDIGFQIPGSHGLSRMHFGFQNDKGAFNYVGDTWNSGLYGNELDKALTDIRQGYAKTFVVDQLAAEGFVLAEDAVQADGTIAMRMRRY